MVDKAISKWSNPATVRRKAAQYLGKDVKILLSTKKDKNIWFKCLIHINLFILGKWAMKIIQNIKTKVDVKTI